MSESKCKKCGAFIIWLEFPEGWRPFDYGKKEATSENPLISSECDEITSGKGFSSHFKTCNDRIRVKMAQERQDRKDRAERRRKKLADTKSN